MQKVYTWKECKKLKEYNKQNNKKRKKDKKKMNEKETTNVASTTESASPSSTSTTTILISIPPLYKRFIFDSGASSDMKDDIGCFKTFAVDRESIEIANTEYIYYTGKGTVMLNYKLPDGSLSLLCLNNILFIPILSKSFFSWPVTYCNTGVIAGVI